MTGPSAVRTRARRSQRWVTVLNGTRLRQLRRQHGLSQKQLAAKAGISQSTIARLEPCSRTTCRSRTLARLAAALQVQPATLTLDSPPVSRPGWC
jgi:transcriptional regulator with XRE-family HTH domain